MLPEENDGLPKYIVNFDELTQPIKEELLKIIDKAIKDKYPQINMLSIGRALGFLKQLLPAQHYKDIKHKIDIFIYKEINGIQKIDSILLDIPPIIKSTQYDFKYDKDIYLTGLHVDQSGWKVEDCYHLLIDGTYFIKNVSTKEIGEHEHFNTFYKVDANTPISFVLENNSGNSREMMVDLEYIEVT